MRREAAVLDATLAELEEVGYAALSFDGVAARARTSLSLIERRWSDPTGLVAHAMTRYRNEDAMRRIDTGSVRGDLVTQCSLAVDLLARLGPRLVVAMSEAWRAHPELCDALDDAMGPTGARLQPGVFDHAVRRGELPAVELPPVFEEVAMPVLIGRIVVGDSVEEAFVEHLVEDVVLPAFLAVPSWLGDH